MINGPLFRRVQRVHHSEDDEDYGLSLHKCKQSSNGTDLRVKALSYLGFKAPYDLNHKAHKGKALLSALCVLCGSNSNLSTCINPHVYGAFKLKSVPLLSAVLIEALTEKVAANPDHYSHSENVDRLFLEELLMNRGSLKL